MKKNEPSNLDNEHSYEINLRDYFAAKCLQGMAIFGPSSMVLEETAKFAYEYADAMMEARVKK